MRDKLRSRTVFQADRFTVVRDSWRSPDGHPLSSFRISGPSFSLVVPLTEDRSLLLVRNLHPSPGLRLLELPGGRIDPGETPRQAAFRELEEETGFRAKSLTLLGRFYPNPHWGGHQGYVFLAQDLRPGTRQLDLGEDLRTVKMSVERVYQRLREGGFHCGPTALGLYLAAPRLRMPTGGERKPHPGRKPTSPRPT